MRLPTLWNLAVAEMRSCRRLARTWVIIVIGTLVAFGTWMQSSIAHAFSSVLGTEAPGIITSPKFMAVIVGGSVISMFSLGILFLAFDIRTRDIQNRIHEIMDKCPVSNIELLAGRLLGILVLLGMAAVIAVLITIGVGLLLQLTDVPLGHPVDPTSLLSFLVWDIVPNIAFVGSLIMLLAIVVRFRLVVLLIGIALLAFSTYVNFSLPYFLQPAIYSYVFINIVASEIAPLFATVEVVLNRFALLSLAAGFLAVAATLHPRRTSSRNRWFTGVAGLALLLTGSLTIWGLIASTLGNQQRAEGWAEVHEEFRGDHPTDITKISGAIEIIPGRSVSLDITLNLNSTSGDSSDTWMFALNPGYRIQKVAINEKNVDEYSFEDGLLLIPKSSTYESDIELNLVARGVPDKHFAYLDTSIDWRDLNINQAQQLARLGTESYVFHPQYVALVPGISWLPSSGTAYGRESFEDHQSDFFELDVEVIVPKDWTVVGLGKRVASGNGRMARFRFNPKVPIPEVALIASKFEKRSIDVGGIAFEIFLSKKHSQNLDALNAAAPVLKNWLEERISDLEANGLAYPFETFSMVEVPNRLRVYGGGWRMPSILAPPSILMVREWGFPLARFDNSLRSYENLSAEVDVGQNLFDIVKRWFTNNLQGGNPLLHFSRNLVNYQSRPFGSGATGIEFVLNELANDLWTDDDGYFSVYTYLDWISLFAALDPGRDRALWKELADRQSVWQRALDTTLSTLDFEADGYNAMHVLHLKGGAVASSLAGVYDKEVIGSFLGMMVDRYAGTTFSKEQFVQTALEAGIDLDFTVGDWLDSHGYPGYFAVDASVERISDPDSDSGGALYQSVFTLRNNEPVPGVVEVFHYQTNQQMDIPLHSATYRVAPRTSMRVATQLQEKPDEIVIDPHMSLNRKPLLLNLQSEKDLEITDTPVLPTLTQIEWEWPYTNEVIVDDLDNGFSIVGEGSSLDSEIPWIIRYLFGDFIGLNREPELDNGLSVSSLFEVAQTTAWTRNLDDRSFGKYRQTFAQKSLTGGTAQAKFSASLPSVGLWELLFHVPQVPVWFITVGEAQGDESAGGVFTEYVAAPEDRKGVLDIEVRIGAKSENIQLNLEGTSMSWQSLGVFDIDSTEVDVLVVDATESVAFADAIHWIPVQEE